MAAIDETAERMTESTPALANLLPHIPDKTLQPLYEFATIEDVLALFAPQFLTATATLDFPSTAAQQSSDLTITVTGAAVGDAVALGTPASPDANSCYTAFVSATDTVTVRFCNFSSGAIDPASGTFRVAVFRF